MYEKSLMMLLLIGLLSCQDSELVDPVVQAPVKFPNVDPELRPYFQRFEDEAAARGFIVDLTDAGITGAIEPIDEDHVAGQCAFPRNRPNEVTVDQAFWVRGSDLFREFIVFHELGHCYLFRPHLESQFQNGACVSIMRSGNGTCLDNYHNGTRAGYIDELFDWDSGLASN